MADTSVVTCRPPRTRPLWFLAGLGAAGVVVAVVGAVWWGGLAVVWVWVGLLAVLVGVACLHGATAEVRADAYGLHSRTLLRRRHTPWRDVDDLRVYMQRGRHADIRRVSVVLHDGRTRPLPLPLDGPSGDRRTFDATLAALRDVHHRYGGGPEPGDVAVITYRSAGRGSAVWAGLCVLLLAGAFLAAWFVPSTESEHDAWRSATPCAAGTPAGERAECLTIVPAVISRTEVHKGKESSRLYFAGGRPVERLDVSREGAEGFVAGDKVRLTLWRHQVREVAGKHYVWREYFAGGGDVAVIAALCALLAGYPAAMVVMRLRGRGLPDDDVLPSALPFAGALAGTAVWLLPLCYLHPTTLISSPVAIAWGSAGLLVTAALVVWAWRATRVQAPGRAPAGPAGRSAEEDGKEVVLAARFLDHTDYNPSCFGSHIVFGDGPPAVIPHPGPGRFAARPIPAERLTVKSVRRVRGGDGDTVPRSWHIAELDDAGKPVRLAASPANLDRVFHALGLTAP
ncbi:PH domain-containing protein [Streptomyces montanisoli]|uniref:PH domain-containing protein n=1 Tax=Streptomyces montanisoli TaxID=2798581 RepID=A0A940RYI1_9ACTN|nr:PH domain-containing protein [Streptomyces montanisoli]MBP0461605.1 PH domain-containing protein [Streptomyces montanisoli]